MSTPVGVTFTFGETERLWHTGQASFAHETPSRFDVVYQPQEALTEILTNPELANGSLLWCERYLEAHIIAQVHNANGYRAEVLSDEHGGDYVVLTTWALD